MCTAALQAGPGHFQLLWQLGLFLLPPLVLLALTAIGTAVALLGPCLLLHACWGSCSGSSSMGYSPNTAAVVETTYLQLWMQMQLQHCSSSSLAAARADRVEGIGYNNTCSSSSSTPMQQLYTELLFENAFLLAEISKCEGGWHPHQMHGSGVALMDAVISPPLHVQRVLH